MMRIIDKYRKEAYDLNATNYNKEVTWRHAILESIFRPEVTIPGKTPLSHLHPDIDKLHLPPGILIADWRKYQVEDHPALVRFQQRCHAAGLHDPWLRNYAFHFYPNKLPHHSNMRMITTGLGFGVCAAFVLYAAEKIYDQFYPTTYIHTEEYLKKHGTDGAHH